MQLLQILLLALDGGLNTCSLLAAGESIVLKLALKVGGCRLQLLTLLVEGVAGIVALLLQDERILLAETVLCHDGVHLDVGNLHARGSGAGGRRSGLVVHLGTGVVARSERQRGDGHCRQQRDKVDLFHLVWYFDLYRLRIRAR